MCPHVWLRSWSQVDPILFWNLEVVSGTLVSSGVRKLHVGLWNLTWVCGFYCTRCPAGNLDVKPAGNCFPAAVRIADQYGRWVPTPESQIQVLVNLV